MAASKAAKKATARQTAAKTAGVDTKPPAPAQYLDRRTLIGVAADLADEYGWSRLTLSLVARTVNRHVTSLYAHVDSVDALRREVALVAMDELSELVWVAALGRTRDDALRAIATVYRGFSRDHPGRAMAMLSTDHRNDAELQTKGRRLAEPLAATFRSFGLDDAQVVHAHRIFSSTVRGLVQAESLDFFTATGNLDDAFEHMISLFVVAMETGQWPVVAKNKSPRR